MDGLTVLSKPHALRILFELSGGPLKESQFEKVTKNYYTAHNVLAGGDGCIGALSNVVPEVCAAWVRAFREDDLAGIAKGQQIIDRLMDLYTVRSPFLPVIKEACRLRGIAATSVGTFPMPNATVEDDAKILELLNREGVQ